MYCWSVLRRSSTSIHRFPTAQRFHSRRFAAKTPPMESSYFQSNRNDNVKTNLLRLISTGIITSSTLALSLYSFSPSSLDSPTSISFSDWSTQPPAASLSQSALSKPNEESKFLVADAYRKKIFFNYEKRIRMRSPPEKGSTRTFNCHLEVEGRANKGQELPVSIGNITISSSVEFIPVNSRVIVRASDGEIFMTPADLMRALVPVFPPSESHLVRDGYLRGERSPGELRCAPSQFFMLFDTNNDGLISFKEYLFFVTLLSIPESSFSVAFKMFDLDFSGEIDREEFKRVMILMRAHNRQGALHSNGIRAGQNLGGSVENGGLVEYFFGPDGNRRLKHDKFVHFLRDLHEEMVKLEFAHYDFKLRGTISAKDFALSMVASADMKNLNKLLDRVDDLDNEPHLGNIRITPEEFKKFSELRRKLQPFSLALFSFGQINGLLTRKDLQRAAEQVCGICLTDNVIEIIFHVFDANGDGSLSSNEFVRVLQKRERDIAGRRMELFFMLLALFECAQHSSVVIPLIFPAFNVVNPKDSRTGWCIGIYIWCETRARYIA